MYVSPRAVFTKIVQKTGLLIQRLNFLQGNDIGIELSQDIANPVRSMLAVASIAAVNVVARQNDASTGPCATRRRYYRLIRANDSLAWLIFIKMLAGAS